jgi:hypothetical protein
VKHSCILLVISVRLEWDIWENISTYMCPDIYTSFTVGPYGNKESHRVTCGCTVIVVVTKVKSHIVVSWVMTLCSLIGGYRIVEETASFMLSVGGLKPSLMLGLNITN